MSLAASVVKTNRPVGGVHTKGVKGASRSKGIPKLETRDFKYGLYTYNEPNQIPRGSASDALNMLSRGTKVETRNGFTPLGTEVNGNGSVRGVFTAHKWDGTEIMYRARGNKLEYYNDTTGAWVEVGTNILPGSDSIYFGEYATAAGAQLWVGSPNSDLIKIMTANPGSYASQYNTSKNFKGKFAIKQNRMFMWQYKGSTLASGSNSALKLSYIDAMAYTTVSSESIGTGDGSTKVFSGTLAYKAGNPRNTNFAVSITDGNETFTDDYMGNLVGSLGGSGTINYMTGAYAVTFNSAPANLAALTASYQHEDSTNTGIADFTASSPRTAGQGATFLQNDGGILLNVKSFDGVEYCLHERKAWALTIGADDTTATNLIYRDKLALASESGAVATADGIYYIDTTIKSRPYVAVIEYSPATDSVLPRDISSNILDLSGYSFDQCVAWEWERNIMFAIRTNDSTNNRILMYNKVIGAFDIVDFYATSFAIKNGALYAGDSTTINVYNLFSYFDDDGQIPEYYWIGNLDDHGVSGLKKTKRLWIEGEIDVNQSTDVYVALDYGDFVKVGTISGSGTYVDKAQAVTIGALVVGINVVGGGSNGATAFHYLTQIKINTTWYKYFQIKFVPTGIGYFSFNLYSNFDIRFGVDKLPSRYR